MYNYKLLCIFAVWFQCNHETKILKITKNRQL
nr:MAG TPA: hypothetical protein [Caudoviricetes sp.]